ncbi:hypothetical protein P4O66_011496 [Electrophorus voltai]|uniref:[histone H3]-lysine(4) N-trimethyltransferase n=1 Tax=Electrophorus voltai TaxID=2609070 RepID=A0AAD9DT74_9TELE|nr:hypothetical protein P4O66_011496 [Electrophorus voltai]
METGADIHNGLSRLLLELFYTPLFVPVRPPRRLPSIFWSPGLPSPPGGCWDQRSPSVISSEVESKCKPPSSSQPSANKTDAVMPSCLTHCRGDGLLRCSQCKCTRYCSTQCQRQAWPEHKRECKCLKHLQPRVPTDSVRLVARIIFRLLSDPEPHPEESYPLAEHQSHLEDMSAEKRGSLTQLCSMLQLYLLQEVCDVSVLPGGLDLMGLLSRQWFTHPLLHGHDLGQRASDSPSFPGEGQEQASQPCRRPLLAANTAAVRYWQPTLPLSAAGSQPCRCLLLAANPAAVCCWQPTLPLSAAGSQPCRCLLLAANPAAVCCWQSTLPPSAAGSQPCRRLLLAVNPAAVCYWQSTLPPSAAGSQPCRRLLLAVNPAAVCCWQSTLPLSATGSQPCHCLLLAVNTLHLLRFNGPPFLTVLLTRMVQACRDFPPMGHTAVWAAAWETVPACVPTYQSEGSSPQAQSLSISLPGPAASHQAFCLVWITVLKVQPDLTSHAPPPSLGVELLGLLGPVVEVTGELCTLDPVVMWCYQVTCNCFSISDGELQDIGVGLYPSMSLLNHDCQPNCVMVFVGKILQLRAIRNIQPHEELTISYTDVLAPGQERQAHLQQQYHFLCQCQRCNREDSDSHMLAGDKTAWMIIRDALPHLEHLRTEHRILQSRAAIGQNRGIFSVRSQRGRMKETASGIFPRLLLSNMCCSSHARLWKEWEELQKESRILLARHAHAVPDTNVYLLRLLDMAMDACISLNQYEAALEYGNRTLGPYRLHYAEPHPSWAVELFRVGKLQHYLGRLEEASNSFTQAYDVMKVTHGTEHPLFNEVSRKLTEVQAEMRMT